MFKKYNTSNNAICTLANPITNTSNTIIASGNVDRFPESNFIITITQFSSWILQGRENMLISTRVGNIFNISERAYEPVPINDTAQENIQQALPFDSWAIIENVYSSEFIKDIQNETTRLEATKLNKWWLRTTLANAWRIFYSNWSRNEVALWLWANWTVLQSNGASSAPSWTSPTVNIWWLGEKTSLNTNDKFVIYRPWEGNFSVEAWAFIPKFSWWDWDLSLSTWTTSLTIPASNMLVKNYSSISISWSAILEIIWVSSVNWAVALLNCSWDFTMSWWTIKMEGQGWNSGARWYNIDQATLASNFWAVWTAGANTSWIRTWGAGGAANTHTIPKWYENFLNWQCWAGGWAGWASYHWNAWWLWWRWGWILIIRVWGKINFTWWIIQANGANWSPWTVQNWFWSGWGGWWGGWTVIIQYNQLTSITWWIVQANWGTGWAGWTISWTWYWIWGAGGWGGGWYFAGNSWANTSSLPNGWAGWTWWAGQALIIPDFNL